jgi:hypothetical protein
LKTEYGRYIKHDNKEIGFERVIRYNDGISSDQVMASGCYPVNFDYASLEVESYYEPVNYNDNNPVASLAAATARIVVMEIVVELVLVLLLIVSSGNIT